MKFSLIVCTYQRPEPLLRLLDSVILQTCYPDQILIIDGSLDNKTESFLKNKVFKNLTYYKIDEKNRGLTKQRNFGLSYISADSKIICFLDDDIVLTPTYFEKLINTYNEHPTALGVGGYIIDEVNWYKVNGKKNIGKKEYYLDGYKRKDSSRFILRKRLGLMPDTFPTFMPQEGHGRSVGFLPPSGKTYNVETFMGGVSSYRVDIFDKLRFSEYFEGYGLYEDTDFTLRLSKLGPLYLNTAAGLYHEHNEEGRPNQFSYGKMVVRNGWYVWRVRHRNPDIISRIKWNLITGLLIVLRFTNVINSSSRKQAFTESIGRVYGWVSILINRPQLKN